MNIRVCGCGKAPQRQEMKVSDKAVLVRFACPQGCESGRYHEKEWYAIASWNKRANDRFGRLSRKDKKDLGGGEKPLPIPVV